MVTAKGQIKLLDFGVAQLLRPQSDPEVTRTAYTLPLPVGTLAYMSPEQLRGNPATFRTDLYSFGTVLYEMATGRRPFIDKVPTALVADIIHKPPPPPGPLNPDLSPRLQDVILKCLEKDPDQRYQSAKELAGDLRRLAAGGAISVPPALSASRATRTRLPRLMLLGSVAIVLVMHG